MARRGRGVVDSGGFDDRRMFAAVQTLWAGRVGLCQPSRLPASPRESRHMTHELPMLPYAEGALEPYISARTLRLHHGLHHQGYVDRLNTLVAGTKYADLTLEAVIAATAGRPETSEIFNNAAQAWSHTFYWRSMSPTGGGHPPAELRVLIEASFGSIDACRAELARVAVSQFGSGWAWLVLEGGRIKATGTANADVPQTHAREAAPRHRRVGTRLLPRPRESPCRLRRGGTGQAGQLGVCPAERRALMAAVRCSLAAQRRLDRVRPRDLQRGAEAGRSPS